MPRGTFVPTSRDDMRQWIDNYEDDVKVTILVGRNGVRDMTVADFRAELIRPVAVTLSALAHGGAFQVQLTATPPGGTSMISGIVTHLTAEQMAPDPQ